ncbi:peptidyl-tRNA hydrolase ICT1, mitochondrial-like [Selaginella moellendorffii]|uniref:peptidyl-tRNA hydrolase ICT1, mitochondrial-like n=1 Tax=Selaginella moellendorffii TaxID=88036 RepID=UPI000D1CC37B|nr:peptidyl-tRNA hydrolase ICT1, mitochondrial-like [Selaginella moellendorffii]|eukprot:XP_024521000.1 peptidyl-tRNA hydrolase ICT1, mitochondrial-like [Selaginella moellendorffii]
MAGLVCLGSLQGWGEESRAVRPEAADDLQPRGSGRGGLWQTAIPRLSIDHVTVSFARSGGAGGQNVNKVNTKVDMRFNVMNAHWLPLQVRNKLLQTICHDL